MHFFELLSAIYYQATQMKVVKRLFLFIVIFSVGSLLLDLFVSGFDKNWKHIIFDFLLYPCILLLFITAVALILVLVQSNHFKNVTYYFNNWGMEKTGKRIDFNRPWSKFLKFKESKHFIFLYITENDAHIVQKRMFGDDELKRFKELISERLVN